MKKPKKLVFQNTIFILIIAALIVIILILYNNLRNLEKKSEIILLSEKFAKSHTYNLTNYNCVNYTTDYLKFLQGTGYVVIRTHIYNDSPIGHQVACLVIEPQTGYFLKDYNYTQIFTPCSCTASVI
jgi:hypothetical protein